MYAVCKPANPVIKLTANITRCSASERFSVTLTLENPEPAVFWCFTLQTQF